MNSITSRTTCFQVRPPPFLPAPRHEGGFVSSMRASDELLYVSFVIVIGNSSGSGRIVVTAIVTTGGARPFSIVVRPL